MKVIEINEGKKVDYSVEGTKITFNDELTLDLQKYQRDWEVELDICMTKEKQTVIGSSGDYYVAQLQLPAIEYVAITTDEENPQSEPLPINMNDVILTLWSIENFLGGNK